MKSKEILEKIRAVEQNQHGIKEWRVERAKKFQKENLDEQVDIEFDSLFDEFVKNLSKLYECKIYKPTAKKILNNAYIKARDDKRALQKIQPFNHARNPFDFLIKNDFRIEHTVFAKSATTELIEYVRKEMPKNSALANKVKNVADKQYRSPRGFTYDYLVKAVAGFVSVWWKDGDRRIKNK